LKDVRPNDQFDLTTTAGTTVHHRVTEQRVLDSRGDVIPTQRDRQELVLVTCFPFNAIKAGGPLRTSSEPN
jgi:sortase A